MRIAEVIGKVTLSRQHPSLSGAVWKLAVPMTLKSLTDQEAKRDEPFVVYDELGASEGAMIAISEGAEAAAPFHPDVKPIDAYNTALLDQIDLIDDLPE